MDVTKAHLDTTRTGHTLCNNPAAMLGTATAATHDTRVVV